METKNTFIAIPEVKVKRTIDKSSNVRIYEVLADELVCARTFVSDDFLKTNTKETIKGSVLSQLIDQIEKGDHEQKTLIVEELNKDLPKGFINESPALITTSTKKPKVLLADDGSPVSRDTVVAARIKNTKKNAKKKKKNKRKKMRRRL